LCLSAQELSAFVCVEQILEGLHQGFLSSMVGPFRKKIQLLLDANDLESEQWRRRIKIVPLASRSVVPAVFETVVQGLLGRNQLEFCYQGISNSVAEVRIVSPQTVLRYKDNWYLDGWCHTRGALRTFALSRINEVALTAVPSFEIDCALLQSHYEQTYGIFDGPHTDDAVIRFTGTAALIVSQECWHPHQQVLKTGPQEHVLKLPFGNARELCMDILRWGDEAEVLEPQAFREEMKKIIKNMQNVYACRKNCNTG
jgi:predicted DNA-binding transcriptional regulator YafY